ncbi:MAG: DUF2271 domain-containing protein [Oscillospiraceae bacterium]|nr:DUF2271 domain-containing protein [Oscillospiraceae bacterium]
MKHKLTAIALACALLLCAACAGAPAPEPEQSTLAPNTPGTLTISFDYEKQSGSASNQFAVWIAGMDGQLVKTLCATKFTAGGGYKNRPDSIATWVGKAMGVSDFDAVATATPKASGPVAYVWNLTDEAGEAVPAGTYWFIVEGTLRWQNRVLYSGQIEIGGKNATAEAEPKFTFAGEGRQPALDEDAPEAGMIANVKAQYIA